MLVQRCSWNEMNYFGAMSAPDFAITLWHQIYSLNGMSRDHGVIKYPTAAPMKDWTAEKDTEINAEAMQTNCSILICS